MHFDITSFDFTDLDHAPDPFHKFRSVQSGKQCSPVWGEKPGEKMWFKQNLKVDGEHWTERGGVSISLSFENYKWSQILDIGLILYKWICACIHTHWVSKSHLNTLHTRAMHAALNE